MMFKAVVVAGIALLVVVRANVAGGIQDYDLSLSTQELLMAQGLAVHPRKGSEGRLIHQGVWFSYPDCKAPGAAIPFSITMDVQSYINIHDVNGHASYVQYFDQTWPEQSKFGLFWKIIREKARFALTGGPTYPAGQALLIAHAPGCAPPEIIGMERAWHLVSP